MKIVEKELLDDMHRALLKSEVDMLKKLQHPMIMKFVEVYQDASKLFIVTELCKGVDLFEDLENNEF